MREINKIKMLVNPKITSDQLFSFYDRNNVCEKEFGKKLATKVLRHSSLIVGAFENKVLVGIARAMFDGVSADVTEFCLALEYQGDNLRCANGSVIEDDKFGIGKKMGKLIIDELFKMGATFISVYIVKDCEERFYKSIGFKLNTGHQVYYIEKRPYVLREKYKKCHGA